MPRTLSDHIIELLDSPRRDPGPISVSKLARLMGVSSALVRSCVQEMVADGTAEPQMAIQNGVNTIQAINRPQVAPAAAEAPAEDAVADAPADDAAASA